MPTGQDHQYISKWESNFSLTSFKPLSGHVPYVGEGVKLDYYPNFHFRTVKSGELPDAFINYVYKHYETGDPHFDVEDFYRGNLSHLHGVTPGTENHDTIFWRPDLGHLSAENYQGKGIPAGFIYRMAYTYPLSDQPNPNHLYIVPTNSTEQTITMQSISGSDGDVLLILNPPNSKTRLYYDSTPGQGGGELIISPNQFVSAIWRNNQWNTHNLTVGDVVDVYALVSCEIVRNHDQRPRNVKYVKGKLLARTGNLRSNRSTNARWNSVASPAELLSTNHHIMYTPDFDGSVMGLWLEVNSKADGSGTVISETFALEGHRTYFRCTPRTTSSYWALSVDSDFDSGKRAWEVKYSGNNTDFGNDCYLRVYELRMEV